MKVYKKKSELTAYLDAFRGIKSTGFVPTMGALHSGHLHLIEKSKRECEVTICSIFVNPTQFNNKNDFANYPDTLSADLEKLQTLSCDIVYVPTIDDLYYNGETAKEFDFGTLTNNMEAEFRPGHFNGMATVIEKFFNIIKPTKAFFGQKDLQQLQIVRELVKQIDMPIDIKSVLTVRQQNGLAKSSRNKLLSKKGAQDATIIYNCLKYCYNNKPKGIVGLKQYIHNKFKQQEGVKLEYVEIVDLKTMLPISKWRSEDNNAICIAAYVDGVRLIDNIIL